MKKKIYLLSLILIANWGVIIAQNRSNYEDSDPRVNALRINKFNNNNEFNNTFRLDHKDESIPSAMVTLITEYTYNEQNKITLFERTVDDGGNCFLDKAKTFTYDENYRLDVEKRFDQDGQYMYIKYMYDDQGRLDEMFVGDENTSGNNDFETRSEYFYNQQGDIDYIISYDYSSNEQLKKNEYSYNNNYNVILYTKFEWAYYKWEEEMHTQFIYDNNNFLIEKSTINLNPYNTESIEFSYENEAPLSQTEIEYERKTMSYDNIISFDDLIFSSPYEFEIDNPQYCKYMPTSMTTESYESSGYNFYSGTTFYYTDVTSIDEIDDEKTVISPNPAKEFISINNFNSGDIYIYNLTGNLVYYHDNIDTHSTIDIRNLNSGIYLVKIVNDTKTYSSKLKINR